MSLDKKLKILFGILSFGLLIPLIINIIELPGGFILSGFILGLIHIGAFILGALIVSVILNFLLKKYSFLTIFLLSLTLSFSFLHYQLYSPTISITVPDGYYGKIHLVLSKSKKNQLKIDSNGIGYLNKWTFNKIYKKPIVNQQNGKNLNNNLVGFNSSTFYSLSNSCCINGNGIQSLTFEIVPTDKIGQKQYYNSNLLDNVDKNLVIYTD